MEQEDDESATEWESLFQQDLETADELGLEVTQPVPGRRRLFNNSHEIPQKQELSPLKHLDSPKNIWDCSSLAPTSPILPGANACIKADYADAVELKHAIQPLSPLQMDAIRENELDEHYAQEMTQIHLPQSGLKRRIEDEHFPLQQDMTDTSCMEDNSRHNIDEKVAANPFLRLKKRIAADPFPKSDSVPLPDVYEIRKNDTQDYTPLEFPSSSPIKADDPSKTSDTPSNVSTAAIEKKPNSLEESKYCRKPSSTDKSTYKKAVSISGQTLYFGYDKLKRIKDGVARKHTRLEDTLLERSVYRLMEDIQAERTSKQAENINNAYAMRVIAESDLDNERESELLVDKYRPKSYVDLLTDEWLNQEVMLWVKQWDQCVFGRTPSETLSAKFRHKTDRIGRPEKRIILLAGPPGYGKTTLAHVIAKQAGYQLFEINASDERNADTINQRLMHAIESQSVFGDKKPNLVVIDEIDGASGGNTGDVNFIKLLVDLIMRPIAPNKKATTGKKKTIIRPLMRPIICICNDLYSPALRPLRAVAQIYNFRKPTAAAVVKRLRMICDHEQVKVETRALSYLVEKADADMRTCLNTLQMLKGKIERQQLIHLVTTGDQSASAAKKKAPAISLALMKQTPIGDKDMQKSVFRIWESIFLDPVESKNATYNLVESNGDYDLLMAGCFDMYPLMEFRDTSGSGSNILHLQEYIALYDMWTRSMFSGHGAVQSYFSTCVMAFQHLCKHIGAQAAVKMQFPRLEFEYRQKTRSNRQLGMDLANHVDARTRSWLGTVETMCSQSISYILRILSPPIRPINPQLLKPAEKVILDRLVECMAGLRLTYHSERTVNGQIMCKLEPAIDELVNFETNQAISKLFFSGNHAIRQIVAQEVEKELIRNDSRLPNRNPNQKDFTKKQQPSKKPGKETTAKMKSTGPITSIKSGTSIKKQTVRKDFFGRPIPQPTPSPSQTSKTLLPNGKSSNARIIFKFHEGFSNAVRRHVVISDFLDSCPVTLGK